ncbi:hypothetical protein D5086_016827 [Populus alba]|uniref:Uncharacterized protein n=2 Tax=Populus alba TaxID=43335 RepID=A0ACC4BVS7_POPAL|nr:ataxin-related family protein [Populus alba]
MIIYASCVGSRELVSQLCGDPGLPTVTEIIRTASSVDFGEDWLKLLLSRICLEDVHLPRLLSRLYGVEILNERLKEITILNHLALCIFGIFNKSVEAIEFGSRDGIDEDLVDVVDTLFSSGLLDLLLCLLRELGPPAKIRKALRQADNQEATTSYFPELCPYKGFRRDLVAVIGNCAHRRKHVQDDIRQENGMLLMLQQCVADEDSPFLRKWEEPILEGNSENQQGVAERWIFQGSVDM